MKKKILAMLLAAAMVFSLLPAMAFAANGPVASAVMNGSSKVDVTVTDDAGSHKATIAWEKNKTLSCTVDGYTVAVETNGSGVKTAKIVSSQSAPSAPAPDKPSDTNAPAPKPGVSADGSDMTWNAVDQAAAKKAFIQSASKDKKPPATALVPVASGKTDADGDKIPSNAHSGDYPGIYFYWNDKQKDDGILKVDTAVFDLFKDGKFYVTAKNSDAYWDYWILQDEGVATSEGYLLYQIPRYFMYTQANNKNGKVNEVKDELKNINMIFIGGDYKDAWLVIAKEWFDEDGVKVESDDLIAELNKLLSFDSNAGKLVLGKNLIKITDYNSAFFGKKVTVKEGEIKGYAAWKNPLTATVKWDDEVIREIKFENQKLKAKITIEKIWDLLPGSAKPGATFIWGAGDTETDEFDTAKAGDVIEVKEGTYWFKELAIEGFTVEEGFKVITVEAGGKYKVSFKNKEDRAMVTPVKVWTGFDPPAGVKALLTNGYKFGETKAVKAGSSVVFAEEMLQSVIYDGYTYTFDFVSVSVFDENMDIIYSSGDDSAVNFVVEKDKSYKVVVTNNVTRIPLPASITVNKAWTGFAGSLTAKELSDLESSLLFGSYKLREAEQIAADTKVEFSELIPDWSVTKDGFKYTAKFASVKVNNGAASNNNKVDFTAVRNTKYTITFTNEIVREDVRAEFNVKKVWEGDTAGLNLAALEKQIKFDLGLGTYKLVAGTYGLSEVFPESPWTWLSADGATRYTVTQSGITVNGSAAANVAAVEKGAYTIVYTNKITAEDVRGTLNVTKAWQGDLGGYTEAALNAMIKFTPALGMNQKVIAGTAIEPSEVLPQSWLSADGATRYTIDQVGITVNGSPSAKFTVAEKGNYNIVYTNKLVIGDARASFDVSKAWVGDTMGQDLAALEGQIKFDLGLGTYKLVPGTYGLSETFPSNPWTWLSADGATRYTVTQVSITVNGSVAANVAAVEKGEYSIIYTNRITAEDVRGTLNVTKAWQGDLGGFTEAGLNAMITFNPALGMNQKVIAGTAVNPAESLPQPWLSADGATRYTIEQVSITVNGNPSAGFTVAEKGSYNIVYTNKLTAEDVRGTLNVTKTWQGDLGGYTEADLNAMITFNPALGMGQKVLAGTVVNPAESLPQPWISTDGAIRYTIKQVGITVNGDPAAEFAVAEKGNYNIVYTNKLEQEPLTATYEVRKVWVDANGNELSAAELALYVEKGVSASFADGLGNPLTLGESNQTYVGRTIFVEETYNDSLLSFQADPRINIRVDFADVAITNKGAAVENNATGAAASFVAKESGEYVITFTNRIVMIDYPTSGSGLVYKGVETNKDTPKDSLKDSTDPKTYFSGGSDDTIYLYIDWYDEDGVKHTTEYWGHFKAGGDNIKHFYVEESALGGYFWFTLDHGNRTTDRDGLSSDQGKWYSRVVLGNNLEYMGFVAYAQQASSMSLELELDSAEAGVFDDSEDTLLLDQMSDEGMDGDIAADDIAVEEIAAGDIAAEEIAPSELIEEDTELLLDEGEK